MCPEFRGKINALICYETAIRLNDKFLLSYSCKFETLIVLGKSSEAKLCSKAIDKIRKDTQNYRPILNW